MSDAELTFVAAVRNRPNVMLTKWLQSLNAQAEPQHTILVGYGSTGVPYKFEKTLCVSKSRCEYIDVRTTGPFRQGHALNIGLRRVQTPYVAFVNVDGVYSGNMAEVILGELRELDNDHQKVVLCERINLDSEGNPSSLFSGKAYVGDLIALPTAVAMELHGFDEFYTWWGDVDLDFVQRLSDFGLIKTWITSRATMWHQFHEPPYRPSEGANSAIVTPGKGLH